MGTINYSRNGDIIEITIRSPSGAKIETHTCDAKDKKRYAYILKYLKDKYGFSPEIDASESINERTNDSVDWWG